MNILDRISSIVCLAAFSIFLMIDIDARSDSLKIAPQSPIEYLTATLQEGMRGQFFSRLEIFSEKHGFAVRIARTTPSGEDFSVQMWREDIKIFGANPAKLNTFFLGVYNNQCEDSKEIIEIARDLIAEMSDYLTQVGDVRVGSN